MLEILRRRTLALGPALLACASVASAADLTIHLSSGAPITRKTVPYQCDGSGAKIGVPAGPFSVEYINGGGNSLVVVPIGGNSLIFANVSSGSGARYTAREYTWWEAQGSATLYSDALSGKLQSVCQPVKGK
jgi:membrane-bound inhibitor of C-type lysozyme